MIGVQNDACSEYAVQMEGTRFLVSSLKLSAGGFVGLQQFLLEQRKRCSSAAKVVDL